MDFLNTYRLEMSLRLLKETVAPDIRRLPLLRIYQPELLHRTLHGKVPHDPEWLQKEMKKNGPAAFELQAHLCPFLPVF